MRFRGTAPPLLSSPSSATASSQVASRTPPARPTSREGGTGSRNLNGTPGRRNLDGSLGASMGSSAGVTVAQSTTSRHSRSSSVTSSFPASLAALRGASFGGYRGVASQQLQARVASFRLATRRHPILLWLMDCLRTIRSMHRQLMRLAKPRCIKVVESMRFQSVMFIITVYALVGDDIRLSSTTRPADVTFNIIAIVAFLLFSFEMVASCIGKDDYMLSFFFWLDFVATMSLILDITWVYDILITQSSGAGSGDTSVARAGRMSRVGTRAGRVIRLIRLIRLLRIIKLYKHVSEAVARLWGRKPSAGQRPGEGTEEEIYAESRVGQKLSHMTTQKVILLILFMLIMLPVISVEEFFRDLPTSSQYGADVVGRAYLQCADNASRLDILEQPNATLNCQAFEQHLAMYIGYHFRQHVTDCDKGWNQVFSSDCKLDLSWIGVKTGERFSGFEQKAIEDHWAHLFSNGPFVPEGALTNDLKAKLTAGERVFCKDMGDDYTYIALLPEKGIRCPEQLRFEERTIILPRLVSLEEEDPKLIFVFDLRPWMTRFAVYNILQTVFICAILAIGAMVFSHDANVLVLQPIERMISKVEKIRDNPLYAMKLGDDTYREKQEEDYPSQRPSEVGWRSRLSFCRRGKDTKVQTLETKILENAIIKLGKLLALGFGEAGSEIIGKNMDDDTATVNAMIPGSKVEAVFGFCDIRNFTDTTEVLQDKVMVFVNQVAEIVHNIVETWHGAANRNIGDAFLIVWRMKEDFEPWEREKVGDMSVISFVQVVAAINKSPVLKEYQEHPALLARLPKYRVRLGFGLHYGWAIEGAIGSEFKIDASYLSPHVNMASRLEAVTRQYQVLILMSDPLSRLCSPEMSHYFRTIDHVTLKGGMSTPMRLHTVDINAESLPQDVVPSKKCMNRFEQRRQREKAKEEKFRPSFKVHELFEHDPDLLGMRRDYPERFFQLFNKGYVNYEAGEWDVSKEIFERTSDMLADADGPSKALLDFMAQYDFESSKFSPKGWPGFRELTES